jgi:hypothetical protein
MKVNKSKTWNEIEKKITKFKKKQLIELINNLYKLSDENQLFFTTYFSKQQDLLKPYKKIIQESMHPFLEENEPLNIKAAQDAVTNYMLATNDHLGKFDLLCFFVECGTNFISTYDYPDDDYFEAVFEAFEDAVDIAIESPEQELNQLQKRLYELIEAAPYTGYGYQDELKLLYNQHF